MVDYYAAFVSRGGAAYTGQYDNLLFVFAYTYARIRKLYKGGKRLKAYKAQEEVEEEVVEGEVVKQKM